MPTELDYSKRGILENIFDPGAWRNLLGGVGSITTDVADVFEQMERFEGSKPLNPPIPQAPVLPKQNVKAGAYLLGGALLLVIILLWRK